MIPSPLIQQTKALAADSIRFAEKMLVVQDKARHFVPLRYNRAQLHYLAHRTKRDLILKARQLGFSTCIQAELFRDYTTSAQNVLVMADKQNNTDKLRRMAERFYEKLPPNIPKPVRAEANAVVTIYPAIGSEVSIATAGAITSGLGSTNTRFHGSECAYWKNAEWVILGALQSIPEHIKDTWVVFESTANGQQGWFYEQCMAALRGDSEWTLHFYAWWWDDDYQLPLEHDEILEYTEEEQALVDLHNLSPEQIKWRRKKQRDLQDGFQQAYPESIKQAFLASGTGVFTIPETQFYIPLEKSKIDGHTYVGGIDWGEDRDFTVLSVYDVTEHREVMIYRETNASYATLCHNIVEACKRWSIEKLIVERNSMGKAAAEHLLNAIEAETWPKHVKGFSTEPVVQMFFTSNKSKVDLVSAFQDAIQSGMRLLSDESSIDAKIANNELGAYVKSQLESSNLWTYSAATGHDDTVIARLLANFGCYELRA